MRRLCLFCCVTCLLLTPDIGSSAEGTAPRPLFVGRWREAPGNPERPLVGERKYEFRLPETARTFQGTAQTYDYDTLILKADLTWERAETYSSRQSATVIATTRYPESGSWKETAPGTLELTVKPPVELKKGETPPKIRVRWSVSSDGKMLTLTEILERNREGNTYRFERVRRGSRRR